MLRSSFPFLALAVAAATALGAFLENRDPEPPISASVIRREPARGGAEPVVEVPSEAASRVVARDTTGPRLRRSVLADAQIVSYYGHPAAEVLGVLGEGTPDAVAARLKRQADEFAAAEPGRKVIPAFHLIAAVAQNRPQDDGSFLYRLTDEELQPYLKLARQHGFLVFLDLQIGRSTVAAEVERIRKYLEDPIIHLALDPEFAWEPNEQPGEDIGQLDGDEINVAQRILDDIARRHNIPNKILVVHQFREAMITGKAKVRDYPGVDLVYDADGFGSPFVKTSTYDQLIQTKYTRFSAIKLFYRYDTVLIPPSELLKLNPRPSVIIYQ